MVQSIALQVRNLTFAADEKVPRFWNGGRKGVTRFFDNLSIFFPEGERFFVESVRAHEKHVTDAALRRDMRGFYGQEGVHSREHVRYNRMLRAQGLPVDELEAAVTRLLKGARKRTTRRMQLGATAALEHFTALMADWLLSDPRLLQGAHPAMAALWRWHAAEENEHKAVAFDVYLAAGGNYPERVAVMMVATLIFWAKVAEYQVKLMQHDGTASSPREWAELVKFLFVEPGGMLRLAGKYLDWYKPGFHPWDLDNRELLEKWRATLEASAPQS